MKSIVFEEIHLSSTFDVPVCTSIINVHNQIYTWSLYSYGYRCVSIYFLWYIRDKI